MSKEEQTSLVHRALDVIALSEKYASVRTTMFLDPKEQSVLCAELSGRGLADDSSFFGGYPQAERRVFAAYPEWGSESDVPIALLKITGKYQGELSHRDYLGAVLGLGLRRETIGDILVGEDVAYMFVISEIADYVTENLKKIGSSGVLVEHCDRDNVVLPEPKYKEIVGSVASLRLDAVLALCLHQSRSAVQKLIEGERVTLNYQIADSVSCAIKENDRISVRGFGKMKVDKIGGQSKKGRQFITIKKYV